MSRIASLSSNTALVNVLQRTQLRLFDAQLQVSTEKKSQNYLGISVDSQRLVNMENLRSITDRYLSNNTTMETRLEASSIAVEFAGDTIRDFDSILTVFGQKGSTDEQQVKDMQTWAFNSLLNLESFLNTEVDGRFLFAGSRTDTAPVNFNLTTLADLQAKYDGARVKYAETRNANLADFSFSNDPNNQNALWVNASNFLNIRRDDDGSVATSGDSSITATSAIFSNVVAGTTINLTGTASNDGTYTVKTVSSDKTKITILTEMLTDEAVTATLTDEAAAGAVTITRPDLTTLGFGDTGNLAFSASADTITAATGGSLTNINVGDLIDIAGSASNDGKYTVLTNTGTVITVKINTTATFTLADESVVTTTGTGDVLFDRETDTITATTANAFSNASAGEIITVANTGQNDGIYTINSVSSDGKTVTVDSLKLTDEGLTTGNTFFDYAVGTKTVFNATANTIQAQTNAGAALAGAYTGLQVGDSITVSGSTVPIPLLSRVQFTDVGAGTDTIQIQDNAGNPVTGIFSDVNAGDTVTIAGATTGAHNVAHTVTAVSADGSTITVSTALTTQTDTNVISVSGASFTNFTTQTRLQFTDNGATDRITLEDTANNPIAGGMDSLAVGMTLTIAGSTSNDGTYTITAVNSAGGYIDVQTALGGDPGLTTEQSIVGTTIIGSGNDATYTISALSSDLSTITVNGTPALLADQTDTDGTTISAAGFSMTTGTKLYFDAATEQISVLQKSNGTTVTNVFDNLRAGMTINAVAGGTLTNAGAFTISSIAGGVITVAENITTSESASDGDSLSVYAAGGTLSASSYYNGDEVDFTHRLDQTRSFEFDLNAIDPAFEKAIRAMYIIAQGKFGTEGGLDQNFDRVRDAKYLLESALNGQIEGTPPFGAELLGNMQDVELNVGSRQVLIDQINVRHERFVFFLETQISEAEDADSLDAITRLLDDSRTLEASYQALARIRDLSLSNFLR